VKVGGSRVIVKVCAGVGAVLWFEIEVSVDVRIELSVVVVFGIGGEAMWEASLEWMDERREKVLVLRAWAFSLAIVSGRVW